jgi:hypothetical protein
MPEFTQREYAGFIVKATELAKVHGDFPSKLRTINENEGFDAAPTFSAEVIRRQRPDVALWLTTTEGREDLHALHNVKDDPGRTKTELDRIEQKLDRHGFALAYETPVSDTDAYIAKRKANRKRGR